MNKEDVAKNKQEERDIEEAQRTLRKHLKSLSKNQLVTAVMDLASNVIQTTELNRALNETLDALKQERAQNEKVADSNDATTA